MNKYNCYEIQLYDEQIVLHKFDGRIRKKISAIFSTTTVIAEYTGIKIETGDVILRNKGNGKTERYSVITSSLKTALNEKAIYQIKVKLIIDPSEF